MIKKIVICIGISICSGSSIFASFNTLNTYLEKHPHQSNRVLQYLNTYQNNNNLSLIKKHHIQQVKKNIYNTHINTKKNDSLLTTFVGIGVMYSNPLYVPNDLEPIIQSKYIHLNTDPGEDFRVRKALQLPLQHLAKAYYLKFGKKLTINSAWRSYHTQQNKFSAACFSVGICAKPGTSEHQNGFTIDIAHLHGDRYAWMQEHAHHYGFHQSYQKGVEIDGLQIEPRHRRRIGASLATHIYHKNMSFTQFHQSKK